MYNSVRNIRQFDLLIFHSDSVGDIILTDTARKDIPEDMLITPHGELKLLVRISNIFIIEDSSM